MARLIEKKKVAYEVSEHLSEYLGVHDRLEALPLNYADLKDFETSVALYDSRGEDTLWTTVGYGPRNRLEIHEALLQIYAILRSEGDRSVQEHLVVDRVDLCMYGNTQPFRVRIINTLNENFDYFYVKFADTSRVYGLELEHILSPNRTFFTVDKTTLIEEHIYGIPGDMFIDRYMDDKLNEVRLAKEFVKFNERCFLRLLGDMHAANFVIDITVDFEENMYRIRSIDFDQQCYEPRKTVYLRQFFRENNAIVNLGIKHLSWETVRQYQSEERSLIRKRIGAEKSRLRSLIKCMEKDHLAPSANVKELAEQLADHYESKIFKRAKTMGTLVRLSLERLMENH